MKWLVKTSCLMFLALSACSRGPEKPADDRPDRKDPGPVAKGADGKGKPLPDDDDEEPPVKLPRPPLPSSVRDSWEKAGAQVTDQSVEISDEGVLDFRYRSPEQPNATWLPAIRWGCRDTRLALNLPVHFWGQGVIDRLKLDPPVEEFGLDFTSCDIGKGGIKELTRLPGLRALTLSSAAKRADIGLADLTQLTQLKHLRITDVVKDVEMSELAKITGLETIYLYGAVLSHIGLADLAKLGELQTLALPNSLLRDTGLPDLAKLRRLRVLNLREAKVERFADRGQHTINDAAIKKLKDLEQLEVLNLVNTAVVEPDLTAFRKLNKLYLSKSPIGNPLVRTLTTLEQLTHLDLQETKMTDGAAADLAKLKELTWLDLSYNKLSAKTWSILPSLKKLRVLWLYESDLNDADMKTLAQCKSLRELTLRSNKITDDGVRELIALPKLKHVRFGFMPGVGRSFEDLRRARPGIIISEY